MVDNVKAKRAAAQYASNITGVWDVENNINVRTREELSDSEIREQVNAAIARDPYLEPGEIEVSVDNGTAILSGRVDAYFEELTRDRDFYDWDPTVEDYDYSVEPKNDAEIAQSIGQELYWAPILDRQDIDIAVDNGVVTLTGKVETWYQRNQATEEAYEGGAETVINQIDVTYGSDSQPS
jgi:osmotically-inducible protein OsmY